MENIGLPFCSRKTIMIFLTAFLTLVSWQTVPAFTQPAPSLSYNELRSLNVSCLPKDTCVRDLSKSRDLSSLNDRNCACDSACVEYGDCCIDAQARSSRPLSLDTKNLGWTCRNMTQFGGIIMKNSCPSNWTGAPAVREKCESDVDSNSVSDPFAIMPVTSQLTGTTYLNYHCAFCNGDTSDPLVWLPRLEFDNLDPYNRTFQNISEDYIRNHLEYLQELKSWGIRLNGEDGQSYPYPAKLYPVIPYQAERLVRPCRTSLISSCDELWFDKTVEDKCLMYEAAVYVHDLTHNLGFRNPHCAICNYVDLSQLVCKPPAAKSEVEQRTFNFNAFSLIVDFNDAKGSQVGRENLCHKGEIYDPFQKKCRNVMCGFPGYILVNNKCVLAIPVTTTSTTTTTTTTSTTASTSTSPTTVTTIATTTQSSTDIAITSGILEEFTTSAPPTYFPEDSTTFPVDQLKYDTVTTENHSVQVVTLITDDSSTTESPKREEKSNSNSANVRETTLLSPPTTPGLFYSQEFIECPKVPVPTDKVNALPNGTIYIVPYDRYYDPFQYLFADNQILVCAFFINETRTEEARFSIVLGYITVVGLSISMVCLVLHLIVFLIVPDLQNLSTKNLSSFALALFFAYFCFIIGNISTLSKLSCTIIAVATCYFFLASFFWMNTMSYDVWRTLRLATQELRVSSGKQWKRYLLYSTYSWGVPLAIASAAIIVDNLHGIPKDYSPGFGVRICWFSERKALLIFFATPLIAIMLANIGFFVSSAKMILSTSHTSSSNYSESSRRNFKLYLRLGIMMGLTWIFGIVAGYLDLETLWYIFIVLNTLQGLFIFIAFTCNRKVRKYFIDRCRSIGSKRKAYRSSSLNSGSGFNSNSTFPSSNTSSSKTMSSQLNETKSTVMSPEKSQVSPMTSPPNHSLTSFKHLEAGMETLY